MKITKKYKTDLAKAMRCAKSGKAYHWPTIAEILAAEIKRLKNNKKLQMDAHKSGFCEVCGISHNDGHPPCIDYQPHH